MMEKPRKRLDDLLKEPTCSRCGQDHGGGKFCVSCRTPTGIDHGPMVEQSPPATKVEGLGISPTDPKQHVGELGDLPELPYPEQELLESTQFTFDSSEGKVTMTPYNYGMKYLVLQGDNEKIIESRNNLIRVINGSDSDFDKAQEIYQTLITRLDKNSAIVLSPKALVAAARRTGGNSNLESGILPTQRQWVLFMKSKYPNSFKDVDDVYQKVVATYGIKSDSLLACNAILNKQSELDKLKGGLPKLGVGVDYAEAIAVVGQHSNKLVMKQINNEMKSGKTLMEIIVDYEKFLEKIDVGVLTS